MTSENFAYWLQGMFELADPTALNARTVTLIKRHLDMVKIHEKKMSFFCTSDKLLIAPFRLLSSQDLPLKYLQQFIKYVLRPYVPDVDLYFSKSIVMIVLIFRPSMFFGKVLRI